MRRKTKPMIASFSKQSDARWFAFLCILRHLNLSFFKTETFYLLGIFMMWWLTEVYFVRKNIRKKTNISDKKHFQGNYAMTFLS